MHKIKKMFPQSFKNFYHLVQAVAANVMYGFPSKKLKVIGVTGTDGKTTTTQMITKIFQEAGKKVAMASTINFVVDDAEEKNLSHFTTTSAFSLQKFISQAVETGCEYLILETSSHSLDQYRVWGVEYKTAVVTNVTREHLDYHGTMENYRKVKMMLFDIVSKNNGVSIVNADMESPDDFLNFEMSRKFAYSMKKNKPKNGINFVQATDIELGIDGSKFKIGDIVHELHIAGDFNIENALAASCVGLSEGIEQETIKEALGKIKGVAGRLESIQNDLGMHIIVDFALTPNALEKLYGTLFKTKKTFGKIIAVFGACGDRDKGKRPIIGEVVSKYADVVIVTTDEPYHEKPIQIIKEIAGGVTNKTRDLNLFLIEDRREAIRKALRIAAADDVIVLTGMGNFESMVVGDKKIPWNDRKVVEEELQKLT
jgi:UDP-N-acetylmuramoyl-L-alanyl-D-glutamate--2,6-diaminopimelate ligase